MKLEKMNYETSYSDILNQMLNKVPNSVDKREGSIIYDALAPAALELQIMYTEISTIYKQTFADTADREYLIKRASERSIRPYSATNAILKGEFNIDIPIKSRLSLEDVNFIAIEKISNGVFTMMCETKGRTGNNYTGKLIPIDYIKGLTKAEITEILIPGEDEEETEHLRQRYLNSLDSQAFGGNIADYREKVMAIEGVGGVKIYPTWNGGGTVKLIIIDSEFTKPSKELISKVQTIVDPETNHGKGVGIAPIGHVVTIEGVSEQIINIETNIIYKDGWTWEHVKLKSEKIIDDYFKELNSVWADSENIIIRTSYIEMRLLGVEGIMDVSHTKLNGVEENFIADSESVAIKGDFSCIKK